MAPGGSEARRGGQADSRGRIPLSRATLLAQSLQIGTARNAIGPLVVVRSDGVEVRLQGKGALQVFEQDTLRTGPGNRALVSLGERVLVALNENTTLLTLSRWEKTKGLTRIVRLSQGEIWVKTNDGGRAIEVETPVATAAAADSEFSMKVDVNGNSTLTVIRGAAEFATAFGMCQTRPSSASRSVRGKACTPPTPANTAAAVSWTRGLFD